MKDELFVMIAEDELLDQLSLTMILNKLSAFRKIDTVKNGKELMTCLESTEILPDLLITDLKMPGMDGLTAIKQIRKHEKYDRIFIVVLSSSFSLEETRQLSKMEKVRFIEKPLDFNDYTEIVQHILDYL